VVYAKRYLVVDILSNIITVIMIYHGDHYWLHQNAHYKQKVLNFLETDDSVLKFKKTNEDNFITVARYLFFLKFFKVSRLSWIVGNAKESFDSFMVEKRF
jgi:hypothetical protein